MPPSKTTAVRRSRGNGEGSVRQRADGRWEAILTVGTDPLTGKQKRRSVYGRTRAEVSQKLAALQVQHLQGVAVQQGEVSLIVHLRAFAESRRAYVRTSTQRNHAHYLRIVGNHPHAALPLSRFRARQAEQMYTDFVRQYSDSVVGHIRTFVNQALRDALRNELISATGVLEAQMPRRTKETPERALTPEEVRRLLAEFRKNRLRVLIYTILSTGLRIGEALALTWDHYDPQAGTLRVERTVYRTASKITLGPPKTRAGRRTLYVSPALAAMLADWRMVLADEATLGGRNYSRNTLIFPNINGDFADYAKVRRDFGLVATRAGLPNLRLHDLRHTFATRLILSGVDPRTVSALLGHTDARVTLAIYTHAQVETSKAAMLTLSYDLPNGDGPPEGGP